MPHRLKPVTQALILFALAATLHAQQPVVTPETVATTAQLREWLHSGDPRLIAWSATLAAKAHDGIILIEMPALIEHWTIPSEVSYTLDEPQREQRRAAQAVLDALIQENAPVPVSTIRSVAEFFPAQALILVARLPLADTASLLHDWTYQASGSYPGRLLARVAAMLLAKQPTSNFIDEILRASMEEISITVTKPGATSGAVGMGSACGDSIGIGVAAGWPEVFTYDLVENDARSHGIPVVNLDRDRIDARRFPENTPWGSCFGVQYLDAVTRHRLIAHWLGLRPQAMSWQPVVNQTIVWTTRSAYERALGSLLEAEREKLQATVDTLIERGLIKQGNPPQLRVTIHCDIKPCPLVPAPTPATGMEIFIPE
jgi:hypothetical protein